MFKTLSIGILAMATASVCTAGGLIKIKGSDTMLELSKKWSEKYMASHPGTQIDAAGGGSSKGISSLIDGSADLCNASRPMKATEREKMKQRHSSLGVEFKTAKDGIAILVNDANPISELTLSQVKGIMSGKITNWKEVGGSDGKISVFTRETASGTYGYMRDIVLSGKDFAPGSQTANGVEGQLSSVSKDKAGIGYGEFKPGRGVKTVKIKKNDSSPAVALSNETVKNDSYPITRYLYIYAPTRPTGPVKDYLDWIMGSEGQAVVTDLGFTPIK